MGHLERGPKTHSPRLKSKTLRFFRVTEKFTVLTRDLLAVCMMLALRISHNCAMGQHATSDERGFHIFLFAALRGSDWIEGFPAKRGLLKRCEFSQEVKKNSIFGICVVTVVLRGPHRKLRIPIR